MQVKDLVNKIVPSQKTDPQKQKPPETLPDPEGQTGQQPATPSWKTTPKVPGALAPFLSPKEKKPIEEYDFEKHGSLVDVQLPERYEILEQYWVDMGRSLVIITLNRKTNQKEYLLFEPSLSDFEYELLERIHEDLRDVLILSIDEIKKDRRKILLEKTGNLLFDYGLVLEPFSSCNIT
jgi:hypothetical protein